MKGELCICPATWKRIKKILLKSTTGRTILRGVMTGLKRDVKRMTTRKTKKRFSRKQLAAQRLFAKRARAGTLRGPIRRKRNLQRFKRSVGR